MKFSIIILSLFLLPLMFCSKPAEKDPRVEKLQNDVQNLEQKNKEQESQIGQLQSQVTELQTQRAAQIAAAPHQPRKMTVEVMKKDIKPALDAAIRDIKKKAETPRRGSQYGMRVEYDLQKAFYGLIETGDEHVPYQAKVIVTFEKFLESEQESKSYGKGSTMLMFSYRKNKWVIDSAK